MNSVERSGVLAAGVWLIDFTKYIDRYPEPSRLATVSEVVRSNGGGAFNLLINLARLRADFPLTGVGRIGADVAGDWILEHCRNHGIDTTNLRRLTDRPTACTDVMTEIGSGRRTFFYLPGANTELRPDHFPLESSTARILYLGYPGLLPGLDLTRPATGKTGVAELLARAQHAGFVTAVDLVSAETSDWQSIGSVLPFVDLLFSNEWEAAQLLGLPPLADESVSAATLSTMGHALLHRGVRRAVILHCSRGAVCVAPGIHPIIQGSVRVPVEEFKGTCGAGDALAAGFLLGFHRNQSWVDCLELAACAAATCLRDLSSSGGIRPWNDCLAAGRGHGFQEFS